MLRQSKMENILVFVRYLVIIETVLVLTAKASTGDRTAFYQNCVGRCASSNCTYDGKYFKTNKVQPLFLQLTMWSCQDECQYDCMWDTVDSFSKRFWNIPQFHGKWPFIRLFGLQEPASVLFSFMNFMAHILMLRQFRKEVRPVSPMYWLWHAYALVCLNAWFWSAVFHARDVPLTEKMDYFCAFSMVLFSLYSMIIRFLGGKLNMKSFLLTIFCLGFFVHHVTYLSLVKFDYGYNMMANIAVGVTNSVGWLAWYLRVCDSQPYAWRCGLFVVLTGLSLLFEVVDFPPVLWLIDAHALWHLSTAGLPFLFYRFLIDDCKYLLKKQQEQQHITLYGEISKNE